MKILSSNEYKKLKSIEEKYDFIVGNTITISGLGRRKMNKLLLLEKEELVRIIIDLNNENHQLKRKFFNSSLENIFETIENSNGSRK